MISVPFHNGTVTFEALQTVERVARPPLRISTMIAVQTPRPGRPGHYLMITADNDRHLVADRLGAFVQGLEASAHLRTLDLPELATGFDAMEMATAS
jgi:hypothetical protein